MKRVVIIFLLLAMCTILFCQQPELVEVVRVVRGESRELQKLEQEISYYKDLMRRRIEINELYKAQNMYSIKQILADDLKNVDKDFGRGYLEAASIKLAELELIYSEAPEVNDYLLFNNAKLAKLQGNDRKAQLYFEEIWEDYPNSELLDSVREQLSENYFYTGQDAKFLHLYENYSKNKSAELNYKIAQANYNLGELSTAKELFIGASKQDDFSIRNKLMLALIQYQENGAESALDQFLTLRGQVEPKEAYYDFIILTLARLYTELGDEQRALAHYNLYVEMNQGNLSPGILYELGNVNLNAMIFDEATLYLTYLTNNYPKSKYFISAKYQLALAEQSQGDFDIVEEKFTEIIAQNSLVTTALNQKYTLLEKYKDKISVLYEGDYSEESGAKLRAEITMIDNYLQKTNNIIRDLYGALDEESLFLLEILEEEYKSYIYTLENVDAVVTLAQSVPNTKISNRIQRTIDEADTTEMVLQLIRLLGHRATLNEDEYSVAKNIAEQCIIEKDMLKTWIQLEDQARLQNKPLIERRAKLSKQLNVDNLRALDIVAEILMQGAPSEDMKIFVDEELAGVNRNRKELHAFRQDVIENFNKKIAEKLNVKKHAMDQEFTDIKELYSKAYSALQEQVEDYQNNYEVTYLDLLFKQTQIADEEYNKYQEKVRNEQ